MTDRPPPGAPKLRKGRFGALASLPPFLALIWRTSPAMTGAMLALRLARALLPIATLYVGKLIIDEVVYLAATHSAGTPTRLLTLLALELLFALAADALGRAVTLLSQLLSERFSDTSSLQLMRHTATLDLATLCPGTYLVQAEGPTGTATRKLLIE